MERIEIARLSSPQTGPIPVGCIDIPKRRFSYLPSYLEDRHAIPLSCSLPLREEPFTEREFQPYFMGLVPEGTARDALAGELGVSADDYLAMLSVCGREYIGDVMAWDSSEEPASSAENGYELHDHETLCALFSSTPEMVEENIGSKLSLAGSQSKVGLLQLDAPDVENSPQWLRPRGLSASTHILKAGSLRDLTENEFLCMHAAKACGIRTASVSPHSYARSVLAVQRFDRRAEMETRKTVVSRLHQEDLGQAFGLLPSEKYLELPDGSLHRIAELIRTISSRPLDDLRQL